MNALTSKFDAVGFGLAVVLHAAALIYVYVTPPIKTHRVVTLEVEIRKPKPPPPPITPPEPEKPPEPPPEPPKPVLKPPTPRQAPKPNTPPPPEAVQKPPTPVFGIDPSQTGGEGISVPTGNTTMADPEKRPKVKEVPPLPPSVGVPNGSEYHPVSEDQLKSLPDIDNDECGAAMKQKWSESESNASGLTGDVILRIELDERGKPRAKVVKGMNKEVDNIAIGNIMFNPRCRFKPAIGKDGKPVAFVIERYVVHFERE